MANRVFLFHETTDNFRGFQFDATVVAADNWSPGFDTLGGATADDAYIYLLDTAPATPVVRLFDSAQTRQATRDITLNSSDTYSGIAVTDTHLVAVNQTQHKLEYYDLTTKAYDSTKDETLPSTTTSILRAICRGGDNLYVVRGGSDNADRRIYKRTLAGAAVSDWALPANTNHDTIYATRNRVVAVRRATGHGDQYEFDGTADTTLGPFGSGTWAASYVTFAVATVAFSTSVRLTNGDYQLTMTWTGGDTGFAQDDLSVNVGSIVRFFATGATGQYQCEVRPPTTGYGEVELTIRENAVGEKNAETSVTVGTYDNRPSVSLAYSQIPLRSGQRVRVTAEWSESVTGFTASDVSVTDTQAFSILSVLNFQGSGTTYTFDVDVPAGMGTLQFYIAEDVVNEDNAALTENRAFRPIPSVMITFSVMEVTPGVPFTVTFTWPETVTNFVTSDVSVVGTDITVGTFTAVSGTVYRLQITPGSGCQGQVTVSVGADVVDEGNPAAEATLAAGAAVCIHTGYPTRYVQAIGDDDPDDVNDVPIRFMWRADAAGFEKSDIRVEGATLQGELERYRDNFYEVRVRPPDTGTGMYTVTVKANAITGGNTEVAASFNWTDTVAGEELFDWNTAIPNIQQGPVGNQSYGPEIGFIVEAKRVRILTRLDSTGSYANKIFTLLHDGSRLTAEDLDVSSTVNIAPGYLNLGLSLVNNLWFAHVHVQVNSIQRPDIYRSYWTYLGSDAWQRFYPSQFGISNSDFGAFSGTYQSGQQALSADMNRWGLFFPSKYNSRIFARNFAGMQQNITDITAGAPTVALGDRVYVRGSVYRVISNSSGVAVESETLTVSPAMDGDIAVYGKWLYYTSGTKLYRVDLEKSRAPAVRARILPQFVKAGESLSLKHLVNGAETLLFESGYAVPDYLSIDADLNVSVATGVLQDDTCELVKLRAFNKRAETPVAFYLVVLKERLPEWKAIETLPIDNGETVNLFDLVPNAKRVEWKTGFTVPSGYSLTGGELTVANQTSEAPTPIELTAFNDEGSRDKTFSVQARVPAAIVSSEAYRYRLLIEGIDVSGDLLAIPNIHQSLDVINPNEFVSDDASFTLRSPAGRYDGRVAGNFWDTNSLNKNGYLSEIELWVDILDTGTVQSKLLFQGLILEVQSSLNSVNARVNCVDRTYTLKNTPVEAVGIEKFSALRPVQETYQGEYAPEASMLPILRDTATVVSGSTPVPVTTYMNAPEAFAGEPTCYVTENRVLTRGGYLDDAPLLKFKTPYRRRHLTSLIKEISEVSGFFNAKVDIRNASPAARKHITSRGNVAFNIEQTKTVRTVVDWTHDPTNDRFYLLLSHPSVYIQDLLVMYTPADDRYETVNVFDPGVQVVSLTTSDFESFYILATRANDFDRSESPDPANHNAAVFDNLDSSRETEETRILKYVKSTGALTTFIDGDDTHPAQIGLHYMAGFENARHLRLREGTFSEARSTFRIHNNQLYYRYAKWGSFGVARATPGGTTAAILSAEKDDYFNYLNFDFDIAENGDVYMVYAEGTHAAATLKVQQYDASAGSSTVIFQDTESMWLGCHEVRLHNNRLYCVLPIQRVVDGNRDIKRSASAVFAGIHVFSRYVKVLKPYDYVQLSCRSLTVHENDLYFAEYPDASTHYAPCNPDLAGWDSDARCNVVPPNKTWLHRVVGDDETEAVVSPWYDGGQPFTATAVKMLSDGEKLHAMVRYGDKFEISAADADAARPENEQWLTFSADVPYYVEAIPSGSLHDAMVAFAKLGNAQLQIVADRFRFVDVDPYEALLSTGLSDAAGQLNYKDANKAFPQSGHVLVGKEMIWYTTRTAARLSGLTRGVGGTKAVAHSAGDRVLFLDKVIHQSSIDNPYQDINIRIDTNKFYNTVRDNSNTTAAVDRESVSRFGTRAYPLNLTLSDHQIPWRQFINAKTLNRLGPIKSIVRIQMKAAYYLDIGDVVTFAYGGEILMPIRIIDIQHTQGGGRNPRRETHIIGQEIKPLPRVTFGNASVSDKTFTAYEAITPFTLPKAENHKASYAYRLEGLPTGVTFDPETRAVRGLPIAYQSAKPVRYVVTDADNPTWSDAVTFNITVNRASLALVGMQRDSVVPLETQIVTQLPYARGGTGLIRYAMPDLDSDFTFDPFSRQLKGTKAAAASLQMTYRASDAAGASVSDTFRFAFVDLTGSLFDDLRIDKASGTFSKILDAPSELSGFTYQIRLTGLPEGWTFNPTTRELTGAIAAAPSDFTLNYEIADVLTDGVITGAFKVFKFYWLNSGVLSKAFGGSAVVYSISNYHRTSRGELRSRFAWSNVTEGSSFPIADNSAFNTGLVAHLNNGTTSFSITGATDGANYVRNRARFKGVTITRDGDYSR